MSAPALEAVSDGDGWRRRLAGRVAWNLVADGFARGGSLALALVAARWLGVEEYGRFALALAAAQYAWLLADASANAGYATREILTARRERPQEAAGLTGSMLLARMRAAGLLTLVALPALLFAPAPLRAPFAAAAISFATIGLLPDWALRGYEDFRTLALAQAGAGLVLLVALVVVLPQAPTAAVAAGAWALSFGAAALIAWIALSRDGRLSLARSRPRLARGRSLVFALGSIGGIACAQTPMLIAGSALPAHEAGLFGAVSRLLVAWIGLMGVLWWPLFGLLARERPGSEAHGRVVAGSAQIAFAASLPAGLVCVQWPRELLTLCFGAEYAAAAPLLAVTGLLLPLYAVLGLIEKAALAHGGEGLRVRAYAAAYALVLAIGIAGLPRFGAVAPLAGLLAGYAAATALYAWEQRRVLPGRLLLVKGFLPMLAGLVLATLWLGARALGAPAVPAIAGGLALYALMLVPILHRPAAEAAA